MKSIFKALMVTSFVAVSFLMTGCNDGDKIIDDNNTVVHPENPDNPTPTPVGEWQSNLSVEIASAKLKNDSAIFGQKKDAKKGLDKRDLKAMKAPNWGQNTLEVVFEMDGKEFNTVFQNVSEEEVQKTEFLIRTNKEGREVRIFFNGIAQLSSEVDHTGRTVYTPKSTDSSNRLLERLKLIDTVAKTEVPFIKDGKLQSYVFTMGNNEKERKFTIVLDTKHVDISSDASQSKVSKLTTTDLEETPVLNLDAPLEDE